MHARAAANGRQFTICTCQGHTKVRNSERSAARLAHRSGGPGVGSSNLPAPTKFALNIRPWPLPTFRCHERISERKSIKPPIAAPRKSRKIPNCSDAYIGLSCYFVLDVNAGHRKGAVAGRCVVRGKEIFTEGATGLLRSRYGRPWLPTGYDPNALRDRQHASKGTQRNR